MHAETQLEISEFIDNLIGKRLVDKYRHLTYAEMAQEPDLEDYREDLLWAEREWWKVEDDYHAEKGDQP